MAIGTPVSLGGVPVAPGGTTTVVTSAASAPSGSELLIVLSTGAAAVAPTGVAAATPTLTGRLIASTTTGRCIYLYGVDAIGTGITTSTVITGTWGPGTTQYKQMRALTVPGLAAATPEDLAAVGKADGTGASAHAITGTLAQGTEIVLAVVDATNAALSVDWAGSGFTEIGADLQTGTGDILSVAYQVVSSTAPVSATATLGASGIWSMLLVPLKAASAGGLAIRETTPLPGATIGVAYTAQLHGDGGQPPVLFDVSSGSLPAGLALDPGSAGSGGTATGPVLYAGISPSGAGDGVYGGGTDAPVTADWTYAESQIGPGNSFSKIFPASWGGSGALPASWAASGMVKGICDASPGTVPVLVWDTVMSSAAIHAFIDTIPQGQTVGFCFWNEPEGSGTAAAFISAFNSQADIIHGAGRTHYDANGIPSGLLMFTDAYIYQYRAGGLASALAGDWIPDKSKVDVYGADVYQREGASTWPTAGLSNYTQFTNWLNQVKGLGKPLAFTEYGINNCTSEALRNTRLQQDWTWVKNNFGPGKAISPFPLYGWMYWWRNMTAGTTNCYSWNRFEGGTATAATWKAILDSAGSGGGGTSGSSGGAITGIPTGPAGTTTPTFRATDAAGATATKALAITVSAPASALAFTQTGALAGASAGVAYGTTVSTTNGVTPITVTNPGGGLPPGLSISTAGVFSGTPTTPGDYTFSLHAADSASPTPQTVDGTFSIHVSGGLSVTTTSLPGGQVGVVYTALLGTAGGTAPLVWGLDNAALPDGLILDADAGTISGTPTAAGSFAVPLIVTDAAGLTARATVTVTIAPATGGLPAIGRRRFGMRPSDWVGRFTGDVWDRAPFATVTFWTALEGGTQYTSLQTTGGIAIDHTTCDANGAWGEIYGPDGVLRMAVDANGGNGPRAWVEANDLADLVAALYAFAAARLG